MPLHVLQGLRKAKKAKIAKENELVRLSCNA